MAPVFVHRARGHQVTRLRHRWSRLARRCRPRRDLDADQLAPRNPSAAPGSVGRSIAPWLRAVGSIDLLLAINRVKIARDARSERSATPTSLRRPTPSPRCRARRPPRPCSRTSTPWMKTSARCSRSSSSIDSRCPRSPSYSTSTLLPRTRACAVRAITSRRVSAQRSRLVKNCAPKSDREPYTLVNIESVERCSHADRRTTSWRECSGRGSD